MDSSYKKLLKAVNFFLKEKGFAKRQNTFLLNRFDNWGIIEFQKSKLSTSSVLLFTVTVGVVNDSIRLYQGYYNINIGGSHWNQRIGFLMEIQRDYWWEINESTDIEQLSVEIISILEKHVIIVIDKYMQTENLKLDWLNGKGDGLTHLQRCINLITLLKLENSENLSYVISLLRKELENKSAKNSFEIYLACIQQ